MKRTTVRRAQVLFAVGTLMLVGLVSVGSIALAPAATAAPAEALPPLCGTRNVDGTSVSEWMFCTDIHKHSCGGSDVSGSLINRDGQPIDVSTADAAGSLVVVSGDATLVGGLRAVSGTDPRVSKTVTLGFTAASAAFATFPSVAIPAVADSSTASFLAATDPGTTGSGSTDPGKTDPGTTAPGATLTITPTIPMVAP